MTILLIFSRCSGPEKATQQTSSDPLDYVNPFIGTGGKGKTYPGATMPFGMVQLSPDNGRGGWDWISGYFHPDSVISGFSHTHLSGTGIGDLYDISFMPVTRPLPPERNHSLVAATGSGYYSLFSHGKETARPGYYSVYLDDYDLDVELTATTRTGIQKYTMNSRGSLDIRVNLGYSRNWDSTTASLVRVVNDSTVAGYRMSSGWAPDQRVYFVSVFSEPFGSYSLWSGDSLVTGKALQGKEVKAVISYSSFHNKSIVVKTGISSVSVENAQANLEAESLDLTFDEARQKAENIWRTELNKVKITSTDTARLTSFYTALYQTMLAPTVFSDVNGQYKGADGHTHQAEGFIRYTTFSLWDTFRAQHPLLTILHPGRVNDMMNSMLSHYDEHGYLPVWDLAGNETHMMTGYHSIPVIADAWLKGFRGFDIEKAYAAMKKSAEADHFELDKYKKYGYVPAGDKNESVSLTLEYAYDDWCLAQVAGALGKESDYKKYSERALAYRHLYDPKTGFMRARDTTGSWKASFSPTRYNSGDYIEANAWQYTWFVPHQPEELVKLMGGKQAFREKLDALFATPQATGPVPEWISGYIGQYVHGNEPCHHIPYLYNYSDQPWKTQVRVRKIMDELYQPEPAGICGNEDCGQMSAWYVFSALGFYPLNPAGGMYAIGTPAFEEMQITLPANKVLTIKAEGLSDKNIFINSITWNGTAVKDLSLPHDQLMQGGELVFTMAPEPQTFSDQETF